MKPQPTITALLLAAAAATAVVAATDTSPTPVTPPPSTQPAYTLTRSIKIHGDDPWGSIHFDPASKTLYLSRMNRLQIVDTAAGKVIDQNASGAVSVAVAPEFNRGFVSNTWPCTVSVFDLKSHADLGTIEIGPNGTGTGAILYDDFSKLVFVCCWNGRSLVPFAPDIDLKIAKPNRAIELESKPEGGMVSDGQGMLYVLLANAKIAVIDTRTMSVATTWIAIGEGLSGSARGPSIDRLRNRLFLGCDSGLVVLSTVDGHELARVPVKGGIGATAFHEGTVIGRNVDGSLTFFTQSPQGEFKVQETLPTNSFFGGGDMAIDPANATLFLAARDGLRPANRPREDYCIQVWEKK